MQLPMTKEARRLRDADFELRLQPRMLWSAESGSATRVENDKGVVSYARFWPEKKYTKKLTETEDNARGRAKRRRTNRALRGWLPYAQR